MQKKKKYQNQLNTCTVKKEVNEMDVYGLNSSSSSESDSESVS